MKLALLLAALSAFSPLAVAQATTNCGSTPSCNTANQTLGDTTNTSTATNTNSSASQAGNSSASNTSGVTISPSTSGKVAQDSSQTTTGTISGGNTTSSAAGGSANGNQSTNTTNASTGPSTSAASTGASTSNSGGNKVSGGNNTATNTAAGGAGGSSSSSSAGGTGGTSASNTSVDASEHSTENVNVKELFIPPVVPPTPPSQLAVGNVVVTTSACGPLQTVVKTPISGTFYGLMKTSKTPLGYTEELEPYTDPATGKIVAYRKEYTDDGYYLFGDQVTQYAAILGVSGARNLAIGGGGNAGAWGQGGTGTSSSNQRLVTTTILRECEVGFIRIVKEVPPPPAPPVVYRTPPAASPAVSVPPVLPPVRATRKPVRHYRRHSEPTSCKLPGDLSPENGQK